MSAVSGGALLRVEEVRNGKRVKLRGLSGEMEKKTGALSIVLTAGHVIHDLLDCK
jgi:hypothetical protein